MEAIFWRFLGLIILFACSACEPEQVVVPKAQILKCDVQLKPKHSPDMLQLRAPDKLGVEIHCNLPSPELGFALYRLEPGAEAQVLTDYESKGAGSGGLNVSLTGETFMKGGQGDGVLWVVAGPKTKLPSAQSLKGDPQDAEARLAQGHRLGQWFFTFKKVRVLD